MASAPLVLEINSKFIEKGSTVRTPSHCEKINSSTENSIGPTVAPQKPPLSRIPLAPSITPANTPRTCHRTDPSHFDPLFPQPHPNLSKTVARNSKSLKQRQKIDATFCEKQTTSALQNKHDQPSTFANLPHLKTASDIFSETFSLLYPKLSSS